MKISMRKHAGASRRQKTLEPIFWLPIDSRLFPYLFTFGHVRGWARFFLEVEMVLSILVVLGTLILVAFSLLS